MSAFVPSPHAAIVDQDGKPTREFYRFISFLTGVANSPGDVNTADGSGLEGGGNIAAGLSLSITPNGVTDEMLRQSFPCSVIGRYQGDVGNVADIQATEDNRVLARIGGILVFTSDPVTNSIEVGALRIDQSPTAETITCDHTIVINVDGVDYKVPCRAA